jgi:uncharacterized protein (DUF3084 family)
MQEVDTQVQQFEFIGSTDDKVAKLVFYATRQGEGLMALQRRQNAVSDRVSKLEEREHIRQLAEAREDERDKRLDDRLAAMTKSIDATRDEVDKIKGLGYKALWVFGGAILLALANALIKGGLASFI